MISKISRGEIWIADLNPQNGTEVGKKRPVLIIQNQVLLDVLHTSTLIMPLTTKLINDSEPIRIRIEARDFLKENSDILVDQIRAIDNNRILQGPLTRCDKAFMDKVCDAVKQVMGI